MTTKPADLILAALLAITAGAPGQSRAQAPAKAPAASEPTAPNEQADRATVEERSWTVAVVKLEYADAEEVARLLSELYAPAVRVVAYRPTNSLLIAGDPRIVGDLERRGKAAK